MGRIVMNIWINTTKWFDNFRKKAYNKGSKRSIQRTILEKGGTV